MPRIPCDLSPKATDLSIKHGDLPQHTQTPYPKVNTPEKETVNILWLGNDTPSNPPFVVKNRPARASTDLNRIVCAANLFENNVLITGVRHYDIGMGQVIELLGDKVKGEATQGFVDKLGQFKTRQEAWVIAKDANQIIRRCGGDTADDGTLYSENLY